MHRGFTLIELLTTLAVVAALAAIAAPPLLGFIQSARLRSAANTLQADFQLARREAIKRNQPVLVCPVGAAGTPLVCGTNWTLGWMICYRVQGTTSATASDFNQCDSPVSADDPNPFVKRAALESTLVATGLPTTAPFVRFNANGSQGVQNSTTGLSFTLKGSWANSKVYTWTIPPPGNISMVISEP